MSNTAPIGPPTSLRRLDTPGATRLRELAATFEELQTVLRCCERLITELEPGGKPDDAPVDDLLVEAVWTLALLCYARSFTTGTSGPILDENDLSTVHPNSNVLEWHKVLLMLREHHAHATSDPREAFSVGVGQNPDGSASAVGISSVRSALVDAATVRQTGAIAYALCALVDKRIAEQQQAVFNGVQQLTPAELNKLSELEVLAPSAG